MAMTQRVITECDYPEHEDTHGEDDEIATVKFGLDGTAYEIDLCAEKATDLRDLLAGYVANGRKKAKATTTAATTAAPAGKPRGQAAKEAREKREYYSKVRDWANQQRTADGQPRFNVSDRGQVAYEIRDAYDRAMAEQQSEQPEQAQQPEPEQYTGALPAELREPAFIGV
jgi:hypothetical protein